MPLKEQSQRAPLSREASAASHLSLAAHVDPWTIKTLQGDYVLTYRLEGIAVETASDDELERWHDQLSYFMRNINSPHLALWSYVDRRKTDEYVGGQFQAGGYAHGFNERYRRLVTQNSMYVNELYLAVLYRPEWTPQGRASEKLDPAFRDKAKLLSKNMVLRNSNAVERLKTIGHEVERNLRRYGPERLGRYVYDRRTGTEYRDGEIDQAPADGLLCSDALEFYGRVINGEWQRMPYLRANIAETLQTARITVGRETIEVRGPSSTVYGGMLSIKHYPDQSFPGLFNELLRSPFEFTFAQSFVALDKAAARGVVKRQLSRMETTADDAVTEVEALRMALDELASNTFSVGVHHAALYVRSPDLKQLGAVVGEAKRALSEGGPVVVREDLGCEAAFYSLMPGNFGDRTRPSGITSRNFVGFSSFHNYPSGKRERNHWGPALTLLKTASGAPYFFSLHRRDVGHFAVYGSTGAGKTVFAMFIVTMLQKTGATVIFFDKDRAAEVGVKALGGTYFPLQRGQPTGFNPFALPSTEGNRDFVRALVRMLVKGTKPFLASENAELDRAINGVFSLDIEHRRLGSVLAYLEPPTADNIAARLLRWVNTQDRGEGALSWVFDNMADTFDPTLYRLIGFDITLFLNDPETRTPVMAYLFHRIEQLKTGGRRGAVIIDEGWKVLDDEYFASRIEDWLKTDRKKNWLLGLLTQSPSDTLGSSVSAAITELTPTKILMPNNKANEREYTEGLGCTVGEYEQLRNLSDASRRFLVKQGENAVICELDLTGLEDDIALLSAPAGSAAVLERVIAEVGDDPKVWVPIYHERRKAHEAEIRRSSSDSSGSHRA